MSKLKIEKVLWIEVKEKVSRNVGLVIGKDITQEQADELLSINENDDEFDTYTKEYALLDGYLGTDINDSEGFSDVQTYIKSKSAK